MFPFFPFVSSPWRNCPKIEGHHSIELLYLNFSEMLFNIKWAEFKYPYFCNIFTENTVASGNCRSLASCRLYAGCESKLWLQCRRIFLLMVYLKPKVKPSGDFTLCYYENFGQGQNREGVSISIEARSFALCVSLTDAHIIRTDRALSSKQKQTMLLY